MAEEYSGAEMLQDLGYVRDPDLASVAVLKKSRPCGVTRVIQVNRITGRISCFERDAEDYLDYTPMTDLEKKAAQKLLMEMREEA